MQFLRELVPGIHIRGKRGKTGKGRKGKKGGGKGGCLTSKPANYPWRRKDSFLLGTLGERAFAQENVWWSE